MRQAVVLAIAFCVVVLIVAAHIYEELVRDRWPAPGPPATARLWKADGELPLDFSRLFNNDGVASAEDPSDTNFDCPDHPPDLPGSGYPAEELPASGAILKLENVASFLFPVITPGEFNNAVCTGQRITARGQLVWPTEAEACTEIVILGAAENGAAAAPWAVEYADGTTRSAVLTFPDWCVKPAPDDTVAAAAPYRYAWDDRARKNVKQQIGCRIFVRRLALEPKEGLAAVVLPDKRNLHVFAMTLKVTPPGRSVAIRADALARKYLKVSQLATAPPADLSEPIDELATALTDAQKTIAPDFRRQLVWLKTQHEYLVERLDGSTIRRGSATEQWAMQTVEDIGGDLKTLLAGRDPFRLRRGAILKGYVSEIDGQIQPYALYVPREYRVGVPARLVVSMHGHGWYRPFQGVPAPAIRDAIVVSPHGRGSMDYMFVAEEDVLACIDEVCKDYNVDPDRVYLMGHSMGGTGSWSLATKYPDRFAAIGPAAANADSKAWAKVAGSQRPDDGAFAWLRSQIKDSLDPVTYAGNLLHVPSFFLHGDKDEVVPVGNSRSMAHALAAAGCPYQYREGKGGGHGWRPGKLVDEQLDYMFAAPPEHAPARVQLRAAYLKYGHAYWVRILSLARADRLAEVDAEVKKGAVIDVKVQNVAAVEFDLNRCPVDASRAVVVVMNGRPVFAAVPPADGILRFALTGSQWERVPAPAGLHKKPYLEGPIADAYTRSFLVVIGTRSADKSDQWALRQEAQRFADDWELLYTKPPRVKADRDVTGGDIARHNLILYGGPQDNTITARIADKLPIALKGGEIQISGRKYSANGAAVKFCYPNPLNRERLVVVIAGAKRARDVCQSNNLFGNWFQWGPYDNRAWFDYAVFDRNTHSAETCLEFGFFGSDWQFNRDTSWFGDPKERAAAPARRIPAELTPPDQKTVYLSDLLPVSISQHKLPVGFDTSAEGRELSIGLPARTYPRGLGVRPPSKVSFNIQPSGASAPPPFDSFKATVGIDLEGATVVPDWRDKQEWVKFLVYGDGRLLYQTGMLKWNSKPVQVDVPIAKVKQLELEVWCANARWLVGSSAWANARIEREDPKAGAAISGP